MLVWLLCRGGIFRGKTSGVSPSNLICIVRNNIIKVLPTIRVMSLCAFIYLKICIDIFFLLKLMAVKIDHRKKKSWTLDTLFIQLRSPDLDIFPLDNHLCMARDFLLEAGH